MTHFQNNGKVFSLKSQYSLCRRKNVINSYLLICQQTKKRLLNVRTFSDNSPRNLYPASFKTNIFLTNFTIEVESYAWQLAQNWHPSCADNELLRMWCGFHLARSCACADDWCSDGNLRLTAVNWRLFNQVDNILYLWSYSSTALLCFLTKTVWARTNLWYRLIFINENYFASIGWIVNSLTSEVKKHSCIAYSRNLYLSFKFLKVQK